MRVDLLGTGAADGWPNPFCGCASCEAQRDAAIQRVATSVLVDGTLLVDLSTEALHRASGLGVDLRHVRTVLVTHAHADHLAPVALLWRQWAAGGDGQPLTVYGPAPVIEEVQRWYDGEQAVRTVTLRPGDETRVGDHTVRALAANHTVPTLLYDVTGRDGARLLYATDTGPLPVGTLDRVAGRGYDLVLLEETLGRGTGAPSGHHDLTSFARTLTALRDVAALGPTSRTLAIHLGHQNPPEDELRDLLASWGAEPGRDGQRLDTAAEPLPVPGGPPASARRRTLLLGGARSGKSALAERLMADAADVVYVATGGERPDDPDWQRRVRDHQSRRPPGWSTVATVDLVPLLRAEGPPLLIDCLTLWLTDLLDRVGAWDEARWAASAAEVNRQVDALVEAWRCCRRRVVAVSNEVGSGVVPGTWAGRLFRDEMGRLNARIAAESDAVTLVVAGRPLPLR